MDGWVDVGSMQGEYIKYSLWPTAELCWICNPDLRSPVDAFKGPQGSLDGY